MAIVVNCRCGKRFKVKDQLAGRKVRCPACKGPLRIPAESAVPAAPAAVEEQEGESSLAAAAAAAEQALLRFEQAQKNKVRSAEEEAAYQEERNRLIASYDQLAGKKGGGKKKGEPTPGKPRKVTIFTKLADALGVVRGTLVFKYVLLMVLLCGGVLGSIYLVQFITTYMKDQTGPSTGFEEKRDALFAKAEAAVKAKKWGEARDALDELRRLSPRLEQNRRFIAIQKQIEEGFERQ